MPSKEVPPRTDALLVRVPSDNTPHGFMVYEVWPEQMTREQAESLCLAPTPETFEVLAVRYGHFVAAFFSSTGWYRKDGRKVTREEAAAYEKAPWARDLAP